MPVAQAARRFEGRAQLLHRAGRHLAAADAEGELQGVYARWVRLVRAHGDARALRDLAADLLGDAAARERASRLTARLPLRMRAGLTSTRRIAAAVALLLAGLAATVVALMKPDPPRPDAILIAIRPNNGGQATAYTVPIHRETWEYMPWIDVLARGKSRPHLTLLDGAAEAVVSPDGKTWVLQRTVPDPGELELFLVGDDGREVRLTNSPGDDGQASWSPDGSRLVFATVRWNPRHRSDLAILSLGTGEVRQITHGDNSDIMPRWSPDGTRIAFVRIFYEMRASEVCWVTVDGLAEQCIATPGYASRTTEGWYDERQVLVTVDTVGGFVLARLDIETETVSVVDRARGVGSWQVSLDGRWVACFCERPGYVGPAWFVYPVDRPDLARRVRLGTESQGGFFLRWGSLGGEGRYLNRLEISPTPQAIPLDAAHRLQAQGLDVSNAPIAVPVLSWRSADTTVARVDSAGTVHPRRLGAVTIYASAGGWRYDSVRVTIRSPGFATLIKETWTDDLRAEWVPFGVPRPALTTGPEGVPAFWHRGDSTYHSGVYSRRAFTIAGGLGLEALVSTPIGALQWQGLSIGLTSGLNMAAIEHWDHRTGTFPTIAARGTVTCSLRYPSEDGFVALQRIQISSARSWQLISVDSTIRSGDWYTIRLQIFPDGRCAFALNGKPLWRSESALSIDEQFRVVLEGKSVGTKILVGPLEIWEGVRGDVDWSVLERADGR